MMLGDASREEGKGAGGEGIYGLWSRHSHSLSGRGCRKLETSSSPAWIVLEQMTWTFATPVYPLKPEAHSLTPLSICVDTQGTFEICSTCCAPVLM